MVATVTGICRVRIQVPVARDLVAVDTACLLTEGDLRILTVLLWAASPNATTWRGLRKAINRVVYKAFRGASESLQLHPRGKRQGVMSWSVTIRR